MSTIDLKASRPPVEWGVQVDDAAIVALAERWKHDPFPLPAFDYPGTPAVRDEAWWFDYITLSVSVLACLWPPEGQDMWRTEVGGEWLDDAPGIFAAFTRTLTPTIELADFAALSDEAGRKLFVGDGVLQLIPERTTRLRLVAQALLDRWDGSARNLVEAAHRDGTRIAELLAETVPGYRDRADTQLGELPFDKLAHLAAAIMAAGVGWSNAGFAGFDDFPVYPDYMLPRVLRHRGVLRYSDELANAVDSRTLIEAGSPAELAIRWATVFAGAELLAALRARGAAVTAPALDYRLWSEAVLGPEAATFGEHHRTITMLY